MKCVTVFKASVSYACQLCQQRQRAAAGSLLVSRVWHEVSCSGQGAWSVSYHCIWSVQAPVIGSS